MHGIKPKWEPRPTQWLVWGLLYYLCDDFCNTIRKNKFWQDYLPCCRARIVLDFASWNQHEPLCKSLPSIFKYVCFSWYYSSVNIVRSSNQAHSFLCVPWVKFLSWSKPDPLIARGHRTHRTSWYNHKNQMPCVQQLSLHLGQGWLFCTHVGSVGSKGLQESPGLLLLSTYLGRSDEPTTLIGWIGWVPPLLVVASVVTFAMGFEKHLCHSAAQIFLNSTKYNITPTIFDLCKSSHNTIFVVLYLWLLLLFMLLKSKCFAFNSSQALSFVCVLHMLGWKLLWSTSYLFKWVVRVVLRIGADSTESRVPSFIPAASCFLEDRLELLPTLTLVQTTCRDLW